MQPQILAAAPARVHAALSPGSLSLGSDADPLSRKSLGLNVWPFVHIEDLASHFATIYNAITGSLTSLSQIRPPHGPAG